MVTRRPSRMIPIPSLAPRVDAMMPMGISPAPIAVMIGQRLGTGSWEWCSIAIAMRRPPKGVGRIRAASMPFAGSIPQCESQWCCGRRAEGRNGAPARYGCPTERLVHDDDLGGLADALGGDPDP